MPTFTDLREVKKILDIDPDDTSEDVKLSLYVGWVTDFLEEITNRDFWYKSRSKPYCGTGTQQLLLDHRPVYPSPPSPYISLSIVYDSSGHWGASSGAYGGNSATAINLVYGTDFALRIDQDDGSSRCGILVRIGDYWNRPQVRQAGLLSPFVSRDTGSYLVNYTAGYTLDTLPGIIRMAANALVAKFRWFFPLGLAMTSDSFEQRSVSATDETKEYFTKVIRPFIASMRNYSFGGSR